MRLFPDEWELVVAGFKTGGTRHSYDSDQTGYGSEAEARNAWRQMRPSSSLRYTLAVIHPPVGAEREPIVLLDTERIMQEPKR